jgi:hypothetical protein
MIASTVIGHPQDRICRSGLPWVLAAFSPPVPPRRLAFLDSYQTLLLEQTDSAVGLPLKEAFLALRRAAVADE